MLIVEDERLNRRMFSLLVSKIAPSATVLQAEDGGAAVALFGERRPDLVLMDLQMPGKNGFQTAEAIRALERGIGDGKRCRIVAVTADVLPETREECLASGMDDYLSKPVGREELRVVLEGCLREGRGDAETG